MEDGIWRSFVTFRSISKAVRDSRRTTSCLSYLIQFCGNPKFIDTINRLSGNRNLYANINLKFKKSTKILKHFSNKLN